jgi:hypothetical protein
MRRIWRWSPGSKMPMAAVVDIIVVGRGDASQCLPRKDKGVEVLLRAQVVKSSAFANISSVNTNTGKIEYH